jgi:hypothetical protein
MHEIFHLFAAACNPDIDQGTDELRQCSVRRSCAGHVKTDSDRSLHPVSTPDTSDIIAENKRVPVCGGPQRLLDTFGFSSRRKRTAITDRVNPIDLPRIVHSSPDWRCAILPTKTDDAARLAAARQKRADRLKVLLRSHIDRRRLIGGALITAGTSIAAAALIFAYATAPSPYGHIRDVVQPLAGSVVFGQLTSFGFSQVGLPLRYVMARILFNMEIYQRWLRQRNYAYWR